MVGAMVILGHRSESISKTSPFHNMSIGFAYKFGEFVDKTGVYTQTRSAKSDGVNSIFVIPLL